MIRRGLLLFASVLLISALVQAEIGGIIQYPGGENGDLQFNDQGTFGGIAREEFAVSISTMDFDDLTDVNLTGAVVGQTVVLSTNGWVPSNFSTSESGALGLATAYGSLSTSGGSILASGITSTPAKLSIFTSAGASSNTIVSTVSDQITVSTTAAYRIWVNIVSTGTGSYTLTFSIRVDGAELSPPLTCSDTPSARCSMSGTVALSSGSIITVYGSASDGNRSMYVTDAQFEVSSLSGSTGGATTSTDTDETLFAMTSSSTSANTTSEINLVGSGVGSVAVPSTFWAAGKSIVINASGYLSSTTTAPGLYYTKIKVGSTVVSISSGIYAGGYENLSFNYSMILTCRATGVSGSLMGQAQVAFEPLTGGFSVATNLIPFTIDLSVSNNISFTWQDTVASSLNTKTLTSFMVRSQ